MGKINLCLKVVFIFFNSLFTGFSAWLIYSLARGTIYVHQMGGTINLNMILSWIVVIGIFGISLLGSHAARTESKCCLTAFAVFMGIGLVLMLISGVAAVVLKKQYCGEADEQCEFFLNISIGVNFGFAFVAMMGLIISTNMINQISCYDNAGQPAIAMRAY